MYSNRLDQIGFISSPQSRFIVLPCFLIQMASRIFLLQECCSVSSTQAPDAVLAVVYMNNQL